VFKIASVSGDLPQTPLGSLRRFPRPPNREGFLAFGNRSFAPSALNPYLALQTKIPTPLAPQTQNPRSATVTCTWRPSIKYVTLFLTNFDSPSPSVTLCHTSRDPLKYVAHLGPPNFSSTKTRTKTSCAKSLSMVSGVFVRGVLFWFFVCKVLSGVVLSVPPPLLEYLPYNRKLNITFKFTFHMYDKKCKKCDFTCSWTPPSFTNCHTFSDPLPPRA